MKRVLSTLAALTLVAAAPAFADTIINFDAIPTGQNINGVNLGGVTLSTLDGSTSTISNGGVGYMSAPNAVTTNGFMQSNYLIMTFDALVGQVTVTGGDRGGDTDQFVMRAYDLGGLLLGSVTTPVFGGNPVGGPLMQDFYTLTIAFSDMKRVEVQSLINAGIGIDDLTFETGVVPEPATLTLVGLGFGALLVRRRRR